MVLYIQVKKIVFYGFLLLASIFTAGIVLICYICYRRGYKKGLKARYKMIDVNKYTESKTVKGTI